ncbi:MAG: hypothetical protein JO356_16025, partial [Acidobacteria bacterium]|nr:hypothetical protein [Acidobacteriota bacterium]
ARARLLALHQPVPRPTKAALAQNKAEDEARRATSTLGTMWDAFSRHPDVSSATKVGEPSLADQEPISAKDVVQQATNAAGLSKTGGSESLSVTTTGTNPPGENEPAPRSDTPPSTDAANNPTPPNTAPATQPDPNELKPNVAATDSDPKVAAAPDPNELKPNVPQDAQPTPAPPQVNELQPGSTAQPSTNNAASGQELADDSAIASSKHKKKKGLSKIVPIK